MQLAHHVFGTFYLGEITQMLRLSAQLVAAGGPKPLLWHCLSPDLPVSLRVRPRRWHPPLWATPFLRACERIILHRLSGTLLDHISNDPPLPHRQGSTGQIERKGWQTALLNSPIPPQCQCTSPPRLPAKVRDPKGTIRCEECQTP